VSASVAGHGPDRVANDIHDGRWSGGAGGVIGSSWARVINALKSEGAKVLAAPLPLTSLADDVAALNRSLDRTEGPIVLAGHAYAGAVIALARPDRVKALVYVTALAPDEGEKVGDVFYRPEPHPQAPKHYAHILHRHPAS
jgi:pimeloyl-ACP methyl ester carboxylesterase